MAPVVAGVHLLVAVAQGALYKMERINIDSYLKSLQADPNTGKLVDPDRAFQKDNIPTPEATYYNVIYYFLLIAGLVAVLSLIYGGVLYVTSAGEVEQAERGKKTVT